MSANYKTLIVAALESAGGYSKAIEALRTQAKAMTREEFREMALPIVAAHYKVVPEQSSKGTGLMLVKDSKEAQALKRIVRDVFPSGSPKREPAEPKVFRLNAGEKALAEQLAQLDPARLKAILARAKELRV